MSEMLVDNSGTVYELETGRLIERRKNGKKMYYALENMFKPEPVKMGLLGGCSFRIKCHNNKFIFILTNKENKEDLAKFRDKLIEYYDRAIEQAKNDAISSYVQNNSTDQQSDSSTQLDKCTCCNALISKKAFFCPNCGQPVNSNAQPQENVGDQFNGVYRYVLGIKQEVRCPRCESENCSPYRETKIKPAKTKTVYKANLNPLKPFTLLDKKEKIVQKEKVKEKNAFICNKCGMKFY